MSDLNITPVLPRLSFGSADPNGAEGRYAPEDASASSGAAVCCLGYPLHGSPAELTILRALAARAASGGPCLSHADLRVLLPGASPSSLAVHVNRLNRRAYELTGRRLILFEPGRGYRLNPYL